MKQAILLLSIILLSVSCTQDDSGNKPNRDYIHFTLYHHAGETGEDTRAEESLNENKIDRLDIFFFDASGTCLYYAKPEEVRKQNNDVYIEVPEPASLSLIGNNITLYILGNCTLNRNTLANKTLQELQSVIHTNAVTFNKGLFDSQENFLMEGSTVFNVPDNLQTDLGQIALRRAAAKIVLNILDVEVDGYTALKISARIDNYLDKTALGSAGVYNASLDDYQHSPFREMDKLVPSGGYITQPFYSYCNDWGLVPAKETYLTLAVDWEYDQDHSVKTYYYRVALDYIPLHPSDDNRHCLRRNHIYTLSVNISELGSFEPEETVVLPANFELRDWTTREIEVSLIRINYLLVSEKEFAMNNIASRKITYSSSHPVHIENIKAYHSSYKFNGDIETVNYNNGNPKFPRINVDANTNTLTINSPIPDNYVPVYISFQVVNEVNMREQVSVVQYPRQYITSERSLGYPTYPYPGMGADEGNNNPEGDPSEGMINFNFYTVTTNSLELGDNYLIGDPLDPVKKQTRTDLEGNNIISPKFVIASHRGITNSKTIYSNAQKRCETYWESQYPKGTWRIPTKAEMLILANLQLDPKSALKNLFVPNSGVDYAIWWTACNYEDGNLVHSYGIDMLIGKEIYLAMPPLIQPGYGVRCVHDIWKD